MNATSPELHVRQERVVASIGGREAHMPLEKFLDILRPANLSTGILPDGVKGVWRHPQGQAEIWLTQIAPRMHNFKWIAEDSPVGSGDGVRYRTVSVALPYVIIFAVFSMQALTNGRKGLALERKRGEIFVTPTPVRDEDTALFMPPLLNCSFYQSRMANVRPWSWLCSTAIHGLYSPDAFGSEDQHKRLVAGHEALMGVLYQAYNRSSESDWAASQFEAGSWFGEYERHGIKPFASMREWEAESARDPLFVLNAKYIPAATVAQVVHHIFTQTLDIPPQPPLNATSCARLVFNNS